MPKQNLCRCTVTGARSYKHIVGADGSIKSVVRAGDSVIDAATLGPRKGKRMQVAEGRHAGLDCVVETIDPDGQEGACARLCCTTCLRCQSSLRCTRLL